MLLSTLTVALGLVQAIKAAVSEAPGHHDVFGDLRSQAMQALQRTELETPEATSDGCSLKNAVVRQNWEDMSKDSRKEYIAAVKCLRGLPSILDASFNAPTRNRYDDFAAVHINMTHFTHGNFNFLSWHRYLVYTYEKTLRDECGYGGYQPYWNWFAHQDDLSKSPVFDGSETSMGGDGSSVPHNGSVSGAGLIWLPSGKGGGCITNGPFVNISLSLGPIQPGMDGLGPVVSDMRSSNPHCLRRDLTSYASSTWLTYENLLNITVGAASKNIALFQNELQGRFTDGFLGLHAAGHYSMGGDASDLYSSISDPAFFLHHTMVDHVWWIWQALHPAEARTVAGTLTMVDKPPSRNGTVDDLLDVANLAPKWVVRDILDTLGNAPLCYIYV